jgi:hypothetical protein
VKKQKSKNTNVQNSVLSKKQKAKSKNTNVQNSILSKKQKVKIQMCRIPFYQKVNGQFHNSILFRRGSRGTWVPRKLINALNYLKK